MKILIILLVTSVNIYASEELALKKIKKFGKVLKTELKKGLKESSVKAIEVCNVKAPEIQKQVSTDAIKIGRVSIKNRNPNNKPKKWMKTYIKQFHQKTLKKNHVVVKLSNGKNGLIKPIKTMPLCLKCHGTNIDKSLKEVILSKYPKDKATGYKLGDIRGFFWAEY